MRPATARYANGAAHHQKVDDGAVVHVLVIPVIHAGADDDHGAAAGFFGVVGKAARHGNGALGRHAGNGFLPGRGVGDVVFVVPGRLAAQPAVHAVVGAQQVKGGGHQHFTVAGLDSAHRNIAFQDVGLLVVGGKIGVQIAAEIGERHLADFIAAFNLGQLQLDVVALAVPGFQIPLAVVGLVFALGPAKANGAARHHRLAVLVKADGFPVGLAGAVQIIFKIAGAQEATGHPAVTLALKRNQQRQVGVASGVVLTVFGLAVDKELAQHHVPHGHGHGGVGALLGVQPDIGQLGHV